MSWLDDDDNYRLWRNENLVDAGMRPNAEPWDVYRAITQYIVATGFDASDWTRLADDVGEQDGSVIRSHPRLLRSLSWGDPDYEDSVRSVIERVLGTGLEHLDAIDRNMPGLADWLRLNDPGRHEKIYGGGPLPVSDKLRDETLTTSGVRAQLEKLRTARPDQEPDEVIGRSKNLLESAAKCVLARRGVTTIPAEVPALVAAAFKAVGLDRKIPPGPESTTDAMKQMIGSFQGAASAIAELRNRAGDGHGSLESIPPEELRDVAAFAQDAAIGITTALIHALERIS